MLLYILKRLALAVPTLLIIAVLTFLCVQLLPGDPAQTILGDAATPQQLAEVRAQLGLDQPLYAQFVSWLGSALTGDFGVSLINSQPVTSVLAQRSVVTMTLAIASTVVSLVIGTVLGAWAALKGGVVDRILGLLNGLGIAVPNFWLGVLIVLVFAVWLRMLPANGWTSFTTDPSAWARSLVLLVAAVSAAAIATIARQTRASFLEVLGRDFVRSLRASGIPTARIAWTHVLRNASIPVVTVVGLQFVALLGGAVIIEQVFALPGVGQLAITAVVNKDIPVIQAVVLYMTVVVLLVNLLLDLVYAWLNPKVRLT